MTLNTYDKTIIFYILFGILNMILINILISLGEKKEGLRFFYKRNPTSEGLRFSSKVESFIIEGLRFSSLSSAVQPFT